jgi:hypothetical protein
MDGIQELEDREAAFPDEAKKNKYSTLLAIQSTRMTLDRDKNSGCP